MTLISSKEFGDNSIKCRRHSAQEDTQGLQVVNISFRKHGNHYPNRQAVKDNVTRELTYKACNELFTECHVFEADAGSLISQPLLKVGHVEKAICEFHKNPRDLKEFSEAQKSMGFFFCLLGFFFGHPEFYLY